MKLKDKIKDIITKNKGKVETVNVGGGENRILGFFQDKTAAKAALEEAKKIVDYLNKKGLPKADDGGGWLRENVPSPCNHSGPKSGLHFYIGENPGMEIPLDTVGDIFFIGPDDKHFFSGNVSFPKNRTVRVEISSDTPSVRLNDNVSGTGPTVKEVSRRLQKSREGYRDMLVSGGAVLGLGKNWEEAEIPLLIRDFGTPVDAGRATTPAGRMDMSPRNHCHTELMEEMVLWGEDGLLTVKTNLKTPEKIIREAARKGGVPDWEKLPINWLEPVENINGPPLRWSIEFYIDGKKIENLHNALVLIDEENNTLEFREMILVDVELEKLHGIADGDGFGRQVIVVKMTELADYVRRIRSMKAPELRALLLQSQTRGLQITTATEPHRGGRFSKFFKDKNIILPLTSTVAELAKTFG